ncbi:MAG: DUF2490 domain-containing protein [Sandaracinaceae bacterium]|nr:DUF2490 domain-containing protein [Sandaracinaceae bacterium]
MCRPRVARARAARRWWRLTACAAALVSYARARCARPDRALRSRDRRGGRLPRALEQRLRTEGDVDVGLRLRLMARVQAPITRSRELLVVVWDEAFVGLNDTAWGQRGGFDQNRFFVGVGWQVIPAQLRLELGYTNQWIVRAATDPVNHIAALNAFVGWQ